MSKQINEGQALIIDDPKRAQALEQAEQMRKAQMEQQAMIQLAAQRKAHRHSTILNVASAIYARGFTFERMDTINSDAVAENSLNLAEKLYDAWLKKYIGEDK